MKRTRRKITSVADRTVKRGEMVILKSLPQRFLEDLPDEDRRAISAAVWQGVQFNEYDDARRAELEFKDANGVFHFIYVKPEFIGLPANGSTLRHAG